MRGDGNGVSVRRVASSSVVVRLRAAAARWGDVALAGALTLFTQVDIWTADDYLVGSKPVFALTALCMTVPIAWRRRAPLFVALAVAGAILLQVAVEPSSSPPDAPFLAWVIAAYSVAAHAGRWSAIAGGAALVVAVDVWAWFTGDDLVFVPAVLGGFWLVGRIVNSRNRLATELEQERERARLAVAEERARIARELHDVVTHTLGVIVLQAGAERLHETAGTPAHEALSSIERSGARRSRKWAGSSACSA